MVCQVLTRTVQPMTFEPKHITSYPAIVVGERHIKRYHVTNCAPADGGGIAPAVEAAAHALLPHLLPEWDGTTPQASWMVLHAGRDGGHYVMVYSWTWGNVVEVHWAAAAQPYLGCPDDDPTNFVVFDRPWVGCTWELPPLGYERSAWVRHMWCTEPADLDAYLADMLPDGPAGQPDGDWMPTRAFSE
jgi:hypothetical protein